MPYRDDEASDLDPSEWPESDADENGEVETVRCPSCGQHIYEDAQRCPFCENYLTEEDAAPRPKWFVATVLVCIAIAATWALGC
jgi:hypothetical protein